MPCVPDYIRGVINVRGEIIPIIDLSQRLFSRGTDLDRFTAIAVIETQDGNGTSPVGIMVDRVNRVREISGGTITAPEVGYKIRPEFLRGIAADGDMFIVLLNENHLFNINDMSEEIAGAVTAPAASSLYNAGGPRRTTIGDQPWERKYW